MLRGDAHHRDRLPVGMRLGSYRLAGGIGDDGTGERYLATHLVLPRRVEIKVLHGRLAPQRPAAVQLLREACVLELLNHPGVPRVHECGVLTDRRPWFAMERVEGVTVRDQLDDDGSLDPRAVAALLRDVGEVLEHAHRHGVIHGDLRPEHVVLTSGAAPFPVSVRAWGCASADVVTAVRADEAYLAPEQLRGEPADARGDVFALGALAYRALTGRALAPAQAAGVITDHVPVAQRCPAVAPELAALVDHMIAPQPERRPSLAQVLVEAAWLASELDALTEGEPYDEVEAEADGVVEAPVYQEELVLIEIDDDGRPVVDGTPRGVRWTPALGVVTAEQGDVISGEIDGGR